jgi:hypothetical protein
MAGFLFSGCKKSQSSSGSTNTSAGNPITAPVDYLGAIGKAQRSATKVIDTVGIKQAIGQFFAVEGRYPKDLNELVTEKYLPAVPKAPAGAKLIYNPTNGDVKVE